MSDTHKTNRAYKLWKRFKELRARQNDPDVRADGSWWNSWSDAVKTGRRFGNQRKMRAKMKVHDRKVERHQNKHIDVEPCTDCGRYHDSAIRCPNYHAGMHPTRED